MRSELNSYFSARIIRGYSIKSINKLETCVELNSGESKESGSRKVVPEGVPAKACGPTERRAWDTQATLPLSPRGATKQICVGRMARCIGVQAKLGHQSPPLI